MRDAKGTRTIQIHEVTQRLHSSDRKQVTAKEVVSILEAFDDETRKYTDVTGKPVDDAFKVLALNKFLPDKIREVLQTADNISYQECKDYAIKQARVINNNKAATEPPREDQP